MLRARSLPGCMLVCFDRFGVQWVPARIDDMCCDEFSCGTPCFPFYRPRKSMGYSGGREENERKKSFWIAESFFSSIRVLLTL